MFNVTNALTTIVSGLNFVLPMNKADLAVATAIAMSAGIAYHRAWLSADPSIVIGTGTWLLYKSKDLVNAVPRPTSIIIDDCSEEFYSKRH